MKKIIQFTFVLLTFMACHNEEVEKLKKENAGLKTELDSTKSYIKKQEDKKKFFGKYVNTKKRGFTIDFKGETSVVITGGFLPFATSYVRDGNLIRIKDVYALTIKIGDLIFTIKDDKTLIGEGEYADGTFVKN